MFISANYSVGVIRVAVCVFLCVISNQSTSNNLVIRVKVSVNFVA